MGCGPEEVNETQEPPETGQASRLDERDHEVGVMSWGRNEFCVGESTHTVDTASGSVIWRFYTDNDSSYSKKQALVIGRVYHPLTGAFIECNNNENVSYNACELRTPIAAGYTSSTGQHRCCIKKGWFGSFVCRELSTADTL
jgi:hypothetical protein